MYELLIESGFSAAHALRNYYGKTEPLHGHNWKVQVVLEGPALQKKVQCLVDFCVIQELLAHVLKPLDQRNLNTLKPFLSRNASAENVAKFIYDALLKRWRHPTVQVCKVTVWEAEARAASYIPPHPPLSPKGERGG